MWFYLNSQFVVSYWVKNKGHQFWVDSIREKASASHARPLTACYTTWHMNLFAQQGSGRNASSKQKNASCMRDTTWQHNTLWQNKGGCGGFPLSHQKKKKKKLQQEMADLTETSSKTINPCSSPHGSMSAICATSQSFAVTLGCQSSSLCRFLCTHGFLGFGGGQEGRVWKCHVIRAPLQSSRLECQKKNKADFKNNTSNCSREKEACRHSTYSAMN